MILCCGEALIDMVPADPSAVQPSYAPLSGGAIFNTAIALGRLDVPVQFLSGVSTDLFGEQLVDALHGSNVGTDLLIRSGQPTTLAFVKLTDGQAQYTFYDENSAGRMIAQTDLPDLGPEITALYFGGISLCGEPGASTYEHLALTQSSNRVLMLDPNIRPSFIQDETVYRARLDRLIGAADIVKVSDEDLDWIVPGPQSQQDKIATLQGKGASLVIMTKGSDGAVAFANGAQVAKSDVPKVTVVDTVGAGDTFNAGFLAKLDQLGLLNKANIATLGVEDITKALEYAAKVAAITVSRAGANPPLLSEI